MDYSLPRADDAPLFSHAFHPMPGKTNALGEYDIRHIGMPATSQRVSRYQDRLPFATR